jgi:DNA-binding SARP family transcriptional activator/Flp pilus assembly protein TadD
MLVLELLGTLSLRDDARRVPRAAQQNRPLGLLALLALGGRQGVSRHRIEAYLWPESTAERARHALDQAVYAVRRTLGTDVIVSTGQELRLNQEFVGVDVWRFDDAIRAKDWTVAVDTYTGTLLDGFHLGDSRELQAWIDAERERVLLAYQTAIEFLADRSAEAGDHSRGVAWRRRLASSDPLSAGRTKKLMLTLAAAGDRAGAVKQARQYQELVRQELEMEPDAEIERLISNLIHSSTAETADKVALPDRPRMPLQPSDLSTSASTEGKAGRQRLRPMMLASITVVALLVIGAFTVKTGDESRHSSNAVAGVGGGGAHSRVPVPAARDAYLRGVSAWDDRTKDGHDRAIVYFRRAAELDPGYAEAYAGLAEAYVRIGYFGYRPAQAMFPKAKAAALRSIELDSTLASARTALGTELIWEHDFVGAEREYRKAISLDSANATAHQWYGDLLMILRRIPEAVAQEARAAELEPLNLQVQNNYATFLNISGDHAGALRHFQTTVGDEPDSAWARRNPWLLANMSRVYADDGQYDKAVRTMNLALAIVPRIPRALHAMAVIYDEMGRIDLARQAFARADTSNEQYAAYRGMVYADQQQVDSAFLWFDRQKEWGIQPMLALQADRRLDPIRGDPRFRALVARLGITPHL